MTYLPDAVHELIEWEVAVAYQQGYRAALADVAAAHAELDEAWRPVGRRRYADRVAQRLADMERYARRLRADLDARAHPDGDWPPVAVAGTRRVLHRAA